LYYRNWDLSTEYGVVRSNVTDTDSDILRQAKDVGEDWPTPGNRF